MSHIAENDRAAGHCDECGNIYTVNIRSGGEVAPIGLAACHDCGGTEFTTFSEHEKELGDTDK